MVYAQALMIAKAQAAIGTPKGGYNDFARSVRSLVYGLWAGHLDRFTFVDSMVRSIDRSIRRAWFAGAAQCGIQPAELTVAEMDSMREMINSQFGYLVSFADSIEANSRGNGLLKGHYARAQLWINRYNEATSKARMMACADGKLVWRLGATEQHCRTCNALDGQVRRTSVWNASGVKPQSAPNPLLECEGWNCGCSLTPTDLPISRGRLPSLP